MKRVECLDYLRGLMALAVMIYHYVSWSSGVVGSENLLGKLGIYAVSMFYILSGLSMGLVYFGRINSGGDILSFSIKRVFRIFPLFWLVVSLYLGAGYASSYMGGKEFSPDPLTIFLNYSLLFGFFDPTAYFNVGAWSIGNEMVFYAILPVLFIFSCRVSWLLPIAFFASILIGGYFAFYMISPDVQLVDQWGLYVNPFNQLFLFVGGLILGVYGRKVNINTAIAVILLAGSFFVFCMYPASGDSAAIVTGVERFIFSFACMAFVAGLYSLNPTINSAPAKVLGFFGTSCYSIYLLHPIVAKVVVPMSARFGLEQNFGYVLAAGLTLAASWAVFNYLESPMMKAGKKVAQVFEGKPKSPLPA